MLEFKTWKRYQNNGEDYYYAPEWQSRLKLYKTSIPGNVEEVKELQVKLSEDRVDEIYRITDHYFAGSAKLPDTDDLIKLPYGCYKHHYEDSHGPERLLKSTMREDIYYASQSLVESVKKDMEDFLGAKEIYDEFKVSYRRGYLLHGKPGCHNKGTTILMFDGSLKNVENVKIGDLLMGPDSKPREVLKLVRGRDKMAQIVPTKGDPFVVNENHILSLIPSGRNRTVKHILNVSVKDYMAQSICYRDRFKLYKTGVEFSNPRKLDLDPYILGLWLGDGTSSEPSITTADLEIKNMWIAYGRLLNLYPTINQPKNNKSATIRLSPNEWRQNQLLNNLRELNLLNNKHVPQTYLTASRQDRLRLLAGLIDTDGSITGKKMYGSSYDIISKWEHLAEQIAFLSRSLGFSAYVKSCIKTCWVGKKIKTQFKGKYYRVSISGNINEIPVILERKKCSPRKQVKDVLRTGFTVVPMPEDNYYGFIVDSDHLYLMGDFTVTHNCGKTSFIRYITNTVLPDETYVIWMDAIPNDFMVQKINALDGLKIFILEEVTSYNSNMHGVKDLLDFLDGELSPINSIIIATTNYPEELQQNLGDRPSRFDMNVEIKEPSPEECEVFFKSFLGRELLADEVPFENLSVAHIKEICLLHKIKKWPLKTCYEKVQIRRKQFKKGFSDKDNVGFSKRSFSTRGELDI